MSRSLKASLGVSVATLLVPPRDEGQGWTGLWVRGLRSSFVRLGAVMGPLVLVGCAVGAFDYKPVEVKALDSDTYHTLLGKYVSTDGRVDYEAWKNHPDDRAALDEFVNQLGSVSPESHPNLFPDRASRLIYWIDAYNALVIASVLSRWPVSSVNEIRPGISFVRGQGFFYNLRFRLGGREINLLDLENTVLREQFKDPRIHFVINCGSAGCPRLDPAKFSGPLLEERLEAAAREFINEPRNVKVSHEERKIFLSQIFEWYKEDFGDLRSYLGKYAGAALARDLDRARDYAIEFVEYDWSLNGRRAR